MAIPLYLAMTAAEFSACSPLPEHIAWMSCHFSPYGTGLTNLPGALPKGSLLILNDRTPLHGHDPVRIRETLENALARLGSRGVLLDLQRPDCAETNAVIKELLALPCPVCVSDLYAREFSCPVFLPPVPLTIPMEEYLLPWQGREIWVEVAKSGCQYTVTEKDCRQSALDMIPDSGFQDGSLHCHYRISQLEKGVVFSLWRDMDDLSMQLTAAEAHGVTAAVGLWQELGPQQTQKPLW